MSHFDIKWKDMAWEKPYYPILKLMGWISLLFIFPLLLLVSSFEKEDAQGTQGVKNDKWKFKW